MIDGFAVGANHEISDEFGRCWRTEITLLHRPEKSAITVRSQCLVSDAAKLALTPKKPYFVKMAIEDGWLRNDGAIEIRFDAHHLDADSVANDFEKIFSCNSNTMLPIVVIPTFEGRPVLPYDILRDLSLELCGIAHVFVLDVESLPDDTYRNLFGDVRDFMVAVFFDKFGLLRTFGGFLSRKYVVKIIVDFMYSLVSTRKPRIGWSFQNVIEEIARQSQEKYRKETIDIDEMFKLTQDALIAKDRIIDTLQSQIQDLQDALSLRHVGGDHLDAHLCEIGSELYDGEFVDRLRYLLSNAIEKADDLDRRSVEFVRRFKQIVPASTHGSSLIQKIKAAGRSGGDAEGALIAILRELGFEEGREANHRVLFPGDLFGLEQQTFSKTPSDYKAGSNAAQRIIRDLRLRELKGE